MIENMAAIRTFGLSGVAGFPVQVEVFSTGGLPGIEVIGLPDASVRESRERVNAAILNSGRKMPFDNRQVCKKYLQGVFRAYIQPAGDGSLRNLRQGCIPDATETL